MTLRYLTKSLFRLACECPSKLFYVGREEYSNTREDDPFLASLAEGGFQVGALAKCYHPEGIEVESVRRQDAIAETNELLTRERVTIFEAALCYENFFVRADILKKDGDSIDLIEVKSKSYHPQDDNFLTKSGQIKAPWKIHFLDVAFQTHIARLTLPQFRIVPHLMLVDKSTRTSVDGLNGRFRIQRADGYTRIETEAGLDPEVLGDRILATIPAKEYVEEILREDNRGGDSQPYQGFQDRISEYAKYYRENRRYPISLGQKCKHCEFNISPSSLDEKDQRIGFRECWMGALHLEDSDFLRPTILDIWNFRQVQQCMDKGIYFMDEIPLEEFFLKRTKSGQLEFKSPTAERQHLQVTKACGLDPPTEEIHPNLFEEIEAWTYPLHFIDFETSMVAIPFNSGRRPFELIAFQISCHTLQSDGSIDHKEWIQSDVGYFPNFDFLIALKNMLDGDDGTILRYAAHENTVLRKIYDQLCSSISNAEDVPTNSDELLAWVDTITEWRESVAVNGKKREVRHQGERNMVDMCELVRKFYYHPAMGGSNSMKSVLPAIISTSEFLRDKYSKPYFSHNYEEGMVWWKIVNETGQPSDPYYLLPPLFDDVDISKDELILDNDHIQEGGAAMLAYAKMQYSDMSSDEREAIIKGLLKYCELDTLAMVMVFEHWNSQKE